VTSEVDSLEPNELTGVGKAIDFKLQPLINRGVARISVFGVKYKINPISTAL